MVEFRTHVPLSDNHSCCSCKNIGHVMKIKMPRTRYFNGPDLETKYFEYWLCALCRIKLAHALDYPGEDWNE